MGKGGSSTSVEIPQYIEDAAKNNLQRADFVSKLGYVPQSFGPTVAAFTPMQQSAFGNTAQTANAFGLGAPTGADIFGGMGEPTTYANGVRAYSAAPLFQGMMDEFAAARPGQFNAINSMFIDPFSGSYNPMNPVLPDDGGTVGGGGGSGGGGGGGGANVSTDDTAPSTAVDGDLWWDSTDGTLKIYYQDPDSSQWVSATPPLSQTDYIKLSDLKTVVAASTDFADFQTRIAAL